MSPAPIATPFILDDLDHTPDLVFSQPFLTAEQVAEAVLACAVDRKRERALPQSTLWLARLAQWMPWLQELLRPTLEKKGARVKQQWRAKGARDLTPSHQRLDRSQEKQVRGSGT